MNEKKDTQKDIPNMTTLCYIETEDSYLMLHRTVKKEDANKDKWIGIGGHFKEGESPEECLLREVWEETGLKLTSFRYCGIVTFSSDWWPAEYMHLFAADGYEGEIQNPDGSMKECKEGRLEWVKKEDVTALKLWQGDKIFLELLKEKRAFFSLKLCYQGEKLVDAVLDGKPLALHVFDPVWDENTEVLILGSFPSVKSRELQFYYANPQNRFWKMIAKVTGGQLPQTIEEKKKLLLDNHIAIWDVVHCCEIRGSSDNSIHELSIHDVAGLLEKSNIRLVITNGGKSAQLYKKYIAPRCKTPMVSLPSTSPANAACSLEKLVAAYREAIESATNGSRF